jgi:hypothetical protein
VNSGLKGQSTEVSTSDIFPQAILSKLAASHLEVILKLGFEFVGISVNYKKLPLLNGTE